MKKGMLPVLLLAALVLLAGCGGEDSTSGDSSALTQGQSEVYGTVTEITGNEITLEVGTLASGGMGGGPDGFSGEDVEMPDMDDIELPSGMVRPDGEDMPDMGNMELPEGMDFGDGGAAGQGGFSGEMPDFGDMELPEGMEDFYFGGGEMPAMGGGGMGGGTTINSTGETLTLTVPVDTPVTISGNESVTTTFSKIAVDNTLRILFDENDNILSIEIMA